MFRTSAEKCNSYKVKLEKSQKSENRTIAHVMNGHKKASFKETDRQSDLPKLYVVKSRSDIVYVGQTTQNMQSRLYNGLNAKNYPYMWKHLKEVDILVWRSKDKKVEDKETRKKIVKQVETLEGEIVFLLRTCNGKWPKHQMEIHFHNAKKDQNKLIELAKAILERAKE
jgi:hypothetical protein